MSELTKRELLAGMAMSGLINHTGTYGTTGAPFEIAKRAVECVDCLLAELARTESKPVADDDDGWIAHAPGNPCPCDEIEMVDVRLRAGTTATDYANRWNWANQPNNEYSITAWRPAR